MFCFLERARICKKMWQLCRNCRFNLMPLSLKVPHKTARDSSRDRSFACATLLLQPFGAHFLPFLQTFWIFAKCFAFLTDAHCWSFLLCASSFLISTITSAASCGRRCNSFNSCFSRVPTWVIFSNCRVHTSTDRAHFSRLRSFRIWARLTAIIDACSFRIG